MSFWAGRVGYTAVLWEVRRGKGDWEWARAEGWGRGTGAAWLAPALAAFTGVGTRACVGAARGGGEGKRRRAERRRPGSSMDEVLL